MSDLIILLLTNLFAGFFTGSIAWVITIKASKKKAEAEALGTEATAKGLEIDNTSKIIKMWQELNIELKTEMQEFKKEFEELEKRICLKEPCKNRII